MYRAIERHVPKGQLVFLAGDVGQLHPYGIRIYSRRPVAWSWKEGGMLAYNNPAAMVEWYRRGRALQNIGRMTGEARSVAFASQMTEWRVRCVVVGVADPILENLDLVGRVLYQNSIGYLIELPNPNSSG